VWFGDKLEGRSGAYRPGMDADAWNRRYAGTDRLWSAGPNQFLAAEAADLPPGPALDLACGEGRNAVWLAERGWTVTGVDFADVALDRGREAARHRGVTVEFVTADVVTYEPPAAAFDLVAVFYLHLPAAEWELVLPRAVAAVAPGGTFLLVGHDRSNLDGGYGGPQEPTVLTTPGEVAARLGDLVVERAEVVERGVDTDDGPRVALDTLVRAHRPQ
jgi:SAM-dependent methyltransferase